MAETYIYVNGESYGPLSVSEIKKWAEEGRLGPDDQVWIAARNEWVPARNVAQFKRIFDEKGITGEGGPASEGLLVNINGEQFGPYPATQIISYIQEGRISRKDYVWIERQNKWFELEKIVQFRQAFERQEAHPVIEETETEEVPEIPEVAVVETFPDTETTPVFEPTDEEVAPPVELEEAEVPVPDSDWADFAAETRDEEETATTQTQPIVSDTDIISRVFADDLPGGGGAIGTIGSFVESLEEQPLRERVAEIDPRDLPLMKANAAKRFGGLIWDFVICFSFIAVLGIIFHMLDKAFADFSVKVFNPSDTLGVLEGAGFLANLSKTFVFISLGVIAFYLLFRDALFGRRSLGKRLAGLRVVDRVKKRPASFGKLVLRNLTVVTLAPLVIEFILVLADHKGLRIGDRIARTQVVDTNI
ncbi:RDD family protein [bacterium]|nr:RDD family protein [bacterium]